MQGRICGAETDYEVYVDGDKVYRALPMVKSHGALTMYRPATLHAVLPVSRKRTTPL